MVTLSRRRPITYPTSDGKPMAETDWHRDLMLALIETLKSFYAAVANVYVSGNLLIFYEPGNRRRHLAPDVFVVKGVRKHDRPNYLVWEEGKGPDLVIELTSSSTRHADTHRMFQRYQDVLRIKEYFLFDPLGDYLDPQLQGYRLRQGEYQAIRPVRGRLPSQVLGLHLEKSGHVLRLFDPATQQWVPTPDERISQAEQLAGQWEQRVVQTEERASQAEQRVVALQVELERLRALLTPPQSRPNGPSPL